MARFFVILSAGRWLLCGVEGNRGILPGAKALVFAGFFAELKALRSLPKANTQHKLLLVFLQLDYYDFDWLVTGIDVGVHRVGRVGGSQ
jgi:hypothetical protein